MKKSREKTTRKITCWCLFGLYLTALAYFLFFAESAGRTAAQRSYQYNLIPFREIQRFICYREQLGFGAVALNLAGNVLAFVPFGAFLPILLPTMRSFVKTVWMSFELSLLVEIVQLFFKVGSFDVDDILLNTAGAALGFILFVFFHKKSVHEEKRGVIDETKE